MMYLLRSNKNYYDYYFTHNCNLQVLRCKSKVPSFISLHTISTKTQLSLAVADFCDFGELFYFLMNLEGDKSNNEKSGLHACNLPPCVF